MNTTLLLALYLVSAGLGVFSGLRYARFLAKRWADSTLPVDSSQQLLRNAEWRRDSAIKTAQETTREHLEAEAARLEEERDVVRRIQARFEQELSERQSSLDKRANEHQKIEEDCQAKLAAVAALDASLSEYQAQQESLRLEWVALLESKSGVSRDEARTIIQNDLRSSEKLAASKMILESAEEVKFESQRLGNDILNTIHSRYDPKFIWPKTAFTVETPSRALAEEHFSRGGKIVATLTEGLGIDVDLMAADASESPVIKISGGSGVEKEALRLSFEEMISKREFNLDKALEIRERVRRQLDRLTLKMGEDAARQLKLPGLDPELLKLVGALNFRTSHRQNQYYHSLEVARLAGMLADELGIDNQLAKRAGFLHDIGKALDYRIDGSHAIISADYAERYGERPEVVETVLSHHDDKIVETPFAYVLKAADAMSGARPGARVEMEEGYQKRLDAISDVVNSFEGSGVNGSAIMNAGREVHVFVDSRRVKEKDAEPLCSAIVKKLETDVEFPGQIRVTVVRRIEVSEVA